jgi:regulator of sigma E protease
MTQVNRAGGGLGIDFLPPLVGGVQGGSPADQAGLRPGDRILSVSGDSVRFWMELSNRIQATGGDTVAVRWRRPDSLQADTLGAGFIRSTPEGGLYQARLAADPSDDGERYLIGIQSPSPDMLAQEFGVRKRTYGPGEALVAGAEQTWVTGKNIVVSLKRIITGRDNLRENLGGPVMVAQITQQAAEAGPDAFWNIVALLSITLAIMNILPIPALDGGQLVFLLYEGITRRKPSVRVRMAAQQIGMILLIGLMAFLIFNDILRL